MKTQVTGMAGGVIQAGINAKKAKEEEEEEDWSSDDDWSDDSPSNSSGVVDKWKKKDKITLPDKPKRVHFDSADFHMSDKTVAREGLFPLMNKVVPLGLKSREIDGRFKSEISGKEMNKSGNTVPSKDDLKRMSLYQLPITAVEEKLIDPYPTGYFTFQSNELDARQENVQRMASFLTNDSLSSTISIADTTSSIELQLKLTETITDKAYKEYLRKRDAQSNRNIAYFVDACDQLLKTTSNLTEGYEKDRCVALAATCLSTLCDLNEIDAQIYRVLAYKLEEMNQIDGSVDALIRARMLRGEEPNSYRDEALMRLRRNKAGDWHQAVDLLCRVVRGNWNARFAQVEIVAAMDLSLALSRAPGGRSTLLNQAALSSKSARIADAVHRFRLLTLDLRVVIRWDLDDSDVELSVKETSTGEKVGGLRHSMTNGGLLSRNFTCGYGPTEFILKNASKGDYEIGVRLHNRTAKTLSNCVTVIVNIMTDFGRASQDERVVIVRLPITPSKTVTTVATVSFH